MNVLAQNQIGLEFGIGRHMQSGAIKDSCGCIPGNGTGTGFTGALFFEMPMFSGVRAGMKARLDYKKTSSSGIFQDSVVFQSPDNAGRIPIEHTLDVSAGYLTLSPYLGYKLPGLGLFFQLGASVSDLVSSELTETRAITTSTVTMNGTTYNNISLPDGSRKETTANGDIADASQLRVAAFISAGYEIPISRSILAPMITYDAPLTNVRSLNASGWKISSVYGTIALKFGL
ncbi:MAG: hypothetical protein Q8921_04685 [Bacteroidota bacterium]|nr:hypothetical protein [Bacteroidota bacterium]